MNERSKFESGECCMAKHANATAPWTCDCECHRVESTPDADIPECNPVNGCPQCNPDYPLPLQRDNQ